MSDENSVKFGGPTVFIQEADGSWGKYLLPEGKRVENGDPIRQAECTLIGKFREAPFPLLKDFKDRELFKEAAEKHRRILGKDTTEVTFTGHTFLTLVPDDDPQP